MRAEQVPMWSTHAFREPNMLVNLKADMVETVGIHCDGFCSTEGEEKEKNEKETKEVRTELKTS